MSFLLLTVVCLWLRPIQSIILWLLSPKQKAKGEEDEHHSEKMAEVDGGFWERLSVFEHIEQGLNSNPDGPAVICTFQPADHLDELVSGPKRAQTQTMLWDGRDSSPSPTRNSRTNSIASVKTQSGNVNGMLALWKPANSGANPIESAAQQDYLTLTYSQLHNTAFKLVSGLLANGAKPNTTMVMLIPNSGEYAVLLWACVLLRITYVSLDPALLDISGFSTLKQMLRLVKPQIVVAPDAQSGKAIDVAVSELQLPRPISLTLSNTAPRTPGWKSLVEVAAAGAKCPADEGALVAAARGDDPRRIHSVMFTSGTSGEPKGCPQTAGGMAHVLHSQAWLVDAAAGRAAVQQPHNARGIAPAQTLQTWKAGGACVMTGQGFSVRDAAAAVRLLAASFLVLTPPMVHEMAAELAARPIDVASVRRVQVGGDAVTKDLLIKAAALFPRAQVCVNHGMTEGPGAFVWPFFRTHPRSISFFGEIAPIGAVAPGCVVRVWDTEKGGVVARGQLGELHISCPSIIRHYLGGRSEESFYDDAKGRWFNTGDMAMVDREGVVFILGRRKDMIKRAGVAIMPAAIESSIEAFTGAQTIVVPAPHHVLGAEPFAVLSTYNGKTEQQIKDHVRAVFGRDYALGGLASLKQLELVEFPLNPTHKIIKSEVQSAVLRHIKRKLAKV
ncbi:hypothetical protein F4775DRAFT_605405 [Biscogniauxia sp. FL1348]|nr:hypothetical protein F4775DRAFT_605405 [Biscogniauxia sp. FL1348]